MTAEIKPIQHAAEAFWEAWSQRNTGELIKLWDSQDEVSSYLPAEHEHRLVGSDPIKKYLTDTVQRFETIRMRSRLVHPRRLNQDLGSIFAIVDWALRETATAQPIGGTIRVSAVLRQRKQRWHICHYAEAPLAPIVELRQFYQKIAVDGHEALL